MLIITVLGIVATLDILDIPATSWPNSRAIVEKNFSGIPEGERDRIVAGYAARLYGL